MRLLIVDDSNVVRRAIEKYLGPLGMTLVGTAGDGETALTIFRQHLPDLVTLDITMPKMDGLACLDAMMQIKKDTKVLIISALSDQHTGLLALKKGARGFLPKPITEALLLEEVRRIAGASV
ncbi:MAG: response regulator [Spirochaetia bacterium]|nr:response regulator [Spirochaetia bacterium]